MSHERKFGSEYPPFTSKCQITTLHIGERDIASTADLADMLIEAVPQCSLTLGRPFGRLADVNQRVTEIQRIDSTCRRSDAF